MNQSRPPEPENTTEAGAHQTASGETTSVSGCPSSQWLILFKPKVGIPLAVLFVLAMIPLAYRSWRISSLPPIDEPFDVEAFCAETIPDEENAFVEYREAFKLYVDETATREEFNLGPTLARGNWKNAPTALMDWIVSNEETLAVWLEGTTKPRAIANSRNKISFENVEYLSNARMITRLARMKAGRHLYENNPTAAWHLLYPAFRFSRHIGQNGIQSERITGMAIFAIVSPGIISWAGHPETTAAEIEDAFMLLSHDYSTMTSPLSLTLKHEYVASLKILPEIESCDFRFEPGIFDHAIVFILGEPEFSKAALDHVFSNQLSGIDSNLKTRPPFVSGSEWLFDHKASAAHPVSGVNLPNIMNPPAVFQAIQAFPVLESVIEARDRERIVQATMMAVLATEHFVRLRRRFPETLEECEIRDSKEPFSDPCQPEYHPLNYCTDSEYAVIYSLGSDGIDNAYTPTPTVNEEYNSWSQLRDTDNRFKGFRIPLMRPESDMKVDQETSVMPDNVQD